MTSVDPNNIPDYDPKKAAKKAASQALIPCFDIVAQVHDEITVTVAPTPPPHDLVKYIKFIENYSFPALWKKPETIRDRAQKMRNEFGRQPRIDLMVKFAVKFAEQEVERETKSLKEYNEGLYESFRRMQRLNHQKDSLILDLQMQLKYAQAELEKLRNTRERIEAMSLSGVEHSRLFREA